MAGFGCGRVRFDWHAHCFWYCFQEFFSLRHKYIPIWFCWWNKCSWNKKYVDLDLLRPANRNVCKKPKECWTTTFGRKCVRASKKAPVVLVKAAPDVHQIKFICFFVCIHFLVRHFVAKLNNIKHRRSGRWFCLYQRTKAFFYGLIFFLPCHRSWNMLRCGWVFCVQTVRCSETWVIHAILCSAAASVSDAWWHDWTSFQLNF